MKVEQLYNMENEKIYPSKMSLNYRTSDLLEF